MKLLKVTIAVNNLEIGSADFIDIKLQKLEKKCLISFRKFNIKKTTKCFINDKINISISYRDENIEEIWTRLKEDVIIDNEEYLKIVCDLLPEDLNYQQNVIDILSAWDIQQMNNWKELEEGDKNAWITACLIFSGVPKTFSKGKNIVIDCSSFKTDLDFYCTLGEVFFGKRGYFGRGIDSLDDCLIEMRIKEKHNTTLAFLNSQKLKDILALSSGNFEDVVNAFERRNFIVFCPIRASMPSSH